MIAVEIVEAITVGAFKQSRVGGQCQTCGEKQRVGVTMEQPTLCNYIITLNFGNLSISASHILPSIQYTRDNR